MTSKSQLRRLAIQAPELLVNQIRDLEQRVVELEQALHLIAVPQRADGTYNRCRAACEEIARAALVGEKK